MIKQITYCGRRRQINDTLNLQEAYDWACNGPHSLIPYKKEYKEWNEEDKLSKNLYGDHLRELTKYVKDCDHITEIGHAVGHTARVFLSQKPKIFVAIDIADCSNNGIKNLCDANNIKYKFIMKNSLSIEPKDFEQTDFLWLDGNHSEDHVFRELEKFSNKVSKYIFSDDIEAEGSRPATHRLPGYGVEAAFRRFADKSKNWEIHIINRLGPGFIGLKKIG